MGFRKVVEIPFLNVPQAKFVKVEEHNHSLLSFGGGCVTDSSKRVRRPDIPVWEKSSLTIDEASVYAGIGRDKIREMTDRDDCPFVLWIGSKRLIRRKKFDDYLDKAFSI